jgi:hypothetical protein
MGREMRGGLVLREPTRADLDAQGRRGIKGLAKPTFTDKISFKERLANELGELVPRHDVDWSGGPKPGGLPGATYLYARSHSGERAGDCAALRARYLCFHSSHFRVVSRASLPGRSDNSALLLARQKKSLRKRKLFLDTGAGLC